MTSLLLFSLLALLPQGDFTSFSFCRDGLGGTGDVQCIRLDASGEGTFMLMYADADTVDVGLDLSVSGTRKFIDLLAGTDYLAEADEYDSGREVLSVGRKNMVLEGPREPGKRAFTLRPVLKLPN